MNSEIIKQNKKEMKNTRIQRTFFLDTLSDKFQQIALKFATLYLFYPFFFSSVLYIKFPFKNFIVYVIFSNHYPNKKLTVWTYR